VCEKEWAGKETKTLERLNFLRGDENMAAAGLRGVVAKGLLGGSVQPATTPAKRCQTDDDGESSGEANSTSRASERQICTAARRLIFDSKQQMVTQERC